MAEGDDGSDVDSALPPQGDLPARATKKRKRKPKRLTPHGGTVESYIAHIEGMMRSLTFVTGETVGVLAAKWGKSPNTVKDYAAEASSRVCAAVMEDRKHVGATVGTALQKAILAASAAGEWKLIAHLADTWAKISGASAATRTEHTGKDGGPIAHYDMRGITDEQLDRILAGDASPIAGASGGGEEPKGDGEDT